MLKIKQLIYPSNNTPLSSLVFENGRSQNLLENIQCYSIAIQSLPGNTFYLGSMNKTSAISIGYTGVFNMDFQTYPIDILQIDQKNLYTTYPTMITIVCQEGEVSQP